MLLHGVQFLPSAGSPQLQQGVRGITGYGQVARVVYENTCLQREVLQDRIDVMHWFANTCTCSVRRQA